MNETCFIFLISLYEKASDTIFSCEQCNNYENYYNRAEEEVMLSSIAFSKITSE